MTKQSHKSPASEAVQSPPAVELASLESRRSLDITLAASDCLLRVEGRMWTYGEWGCMRVCICACVRPHLYFEKLNLLCYIKDLLPKAWRWQKDFTSEMRVTDPLCTWHALPLASPPPPASPLSHGKVWNGEYCLSYLDFMRIDTMMVMMNVGMVTALIMMITHKAKNRKQQ